MPKKVTIEIKGGEKLRARLAEISRKVAGRGKLRVGFLEGATYANGMPVAAVAAIHNFGAPRANIPRRAFFSNMVAERSPTWGDALAKNLEAVDYDGPAALAMMGQLIAGQLRQSIQDTNEPPLQPATVKRKGFDKPLIDTGHMYNSVDFDVEG